MEQAFGGDTDDQHGRALPEVKIGGFHQGLVEERIEKEGSRKKSPEEADHPPKVPKYDAGREKTHAVSNGIYEVEIVFKDEVEDPDIGNEEGDVHGLEEIFPDQGAEKAEDGRKQNPNTRRYPLPERVISPFRRRVRQKRYSNGSGKRQHPEDPQCAVIDRLGIPLHGL